MQFSDITGHEQIIAHLQNAIKKNRVSHAYILDGPESSGKTMLAEAFAQALLCEEQGICGCGRCRSCRQTEGRNHPDLIYVNPEKPSVFSVDDVREKINDTIAVRPYNLSSRFKIYIVDETEKMTVQAQNALLKTIEEPPEYIVMLLLTTNADLFLPTIRSRCVSLPLHPVADEKIRALLMRKYQVVDYRADICTAFAQGNVGRAIELAGSGDFNALRERTIRLLCEVRDTDAGLLTEKIKEIQEFDETEEFFDLVLFWFRDVLLLKSGGPEEKLLYSDWISEIEKQAEVFSYAGLNCILDAIRTARHRTAFNVNAGMAIEMLLLTIKEQ